LRGKKRLLRFGVLFLACVAAAAAGAQINYSTREPVVLHDGSGSGSFTLTNAGRIAVPLQLRVGNFVDDTSQTSLGEQKVTLSSETGTPVPTYMLPGASLRVNVDVSNMNRAGLASAPLFAGPTELGRLRVVDADAPLNVTIVGNSGPDQRLVLANGDSAILTLNNNDGEAYPLDWSFLIDGKMLQNGELQLAPHGTSRIELIPTSDLYSWTDNIRPSRRTGTLHIALHGPPEVARELLPERTLQVNLLMRKLSPALTSVFMYGFVSLVLLLGGLISLIANSVLPNILRKNSLRKQIEPLSDRTASIGPAVDPYLRNLLRMERKRIDLLIKKSRPLSLSSSDTLDQISSGIDRLARRLKATERLEEIQRRLADAAQTTPPSITDEIESRLNRAAHHLHSFALPEEDLNAANKTLDASESALRALGNTEGLANLIATRFRDLKVRQKSLPYTYYHDLKTALPGLFEMLNQPFEDPKNITRPMMFAIDYGVSALQLAFDYSLLRVSVPATAVTPAILQGSAVTPQQTVQGQRDRLLSHQPELISLLGTLSTSALRDLRSLVQEMRENIYERDVLDEIAAAGQTEILLDPKTVRVFTPVLFSLRFKDPRYNDAAAARRLACKWDFPGELIEDWKVCHFFQGNEAKRDEGPGVTVSARVESRKPDDDLKASSKPLRNTISTTFEIHRAERPSYSSAFAEGLRFLIAFAVALAGLFTGAWSQLEKLDFIPAMIAVLAIGFGADTIKNLLMQTARKSTA
jgi:hypothetical protein